MRELAYERRFRRWAAAAGVVWERLEHERASGGVSRAHRLTPPSAARGRVIVVHGGGNDALFGMVGLMRSLLERELEVFAFDLDGHGRHSTTVFAADTAPGAIPEAVRRAEHGRDPLPLHLVGVSLGGSLLLRALPGLPAASAALVAAPLRIELTWRSAVREIGPRLLATLLRERRHYGATGLVPSVGPFRRGLYPLRLERHPPGPFGYVEVLNDAMERLRLEECAAAVAAPTLLIYGARDLIVPATQGERLSALLPRGRLLTVPGETHLSLPLAPNVTEAIVSWIEGHADPNAAPDAGRAGGRR